MRVATEKFLRTGYSATTVKSISQELGISTGHLTFYYPTKEHLLAVLVDMLCDFQWKMMERMDREGASDLAAMCLELTAMASMCQENAIARDFYLSAYSQPMTLDIIRRNDVGRAKRVFADFCPDWTDMMYAEAEVLVSGIEYATLMITEASPPLDVRISGALNQIFLIYQVPEDVRRRLIGEVLRQDYVGIGRQIFGDFMAYIEQVNEQVFEDLLNPSKEAIK